MKRYSNLIVLFIVVYPMLTHAQTDTIKSNKNTRLSIQSAIDSVSNAKLTDTINNTVNNKSKTKGTPDVLILINGDVLTGDIIIFKNS